MIVNLKNNIFAQKIENLYGKNSTAISKQQKKDKDDNYLCTDSLNFSSSRNWSMRNTNSLLKEVIADPQI